MTELIALDMPLGPALVREIARAHDHGDAVCVLDQRLTLARQQAMLEVLAPTRLRDGSGEDTVVANGVPVEAGDGLVVATSGSSGPPKVAILTWTAVIASAELTTTELYRGVPTVWNAVLPPVHIGGFAVLARSVFTDDRVIFGEPTTLHVGPDEGATHVAVVQAHLARHDLSRYHVVLVGGARPPADLPPNAVTTWGMTETGSGVVYNRRPLPDVHIAVVDGEILVRSPTLLRTYRDRPAPFVAGPDGRTDWLATGDAGLINDGELYVTGRMGHVITTGGEKVWPEDLERVLTGVPGVRDVAVVGVADDEWGQRVVALVVARGSTATLHRQCRDVAVAAIGPWAAPKQLVRVSAIPRTDSGKVRRDALAALVS